MNDQNQAHQLNELVDGLFGEAQTTILGTASPPFDISKPNIHDSKKEFQKELCAVQCVVDNVQEILNVILGEDGKDQQHNEFIKRLRKAIDLAARQRLSPKQLESPRDLVLRNLRSC